jgi:outer membrane protein insertion porin family
MNRLLICLATVVFFATGAISREVARLQDVKTTTRMGEQPCGELVSQGRPTLKRRAPALDKSSSTPDRTENEPAKQEKCRPGTVENLVRLKFEGLNAFSESDVLRVFREQGVMLSAENMSDFEEDDKAVGAFEKLLQSRGYMHAKVNLFGDPSSKSVTFFVEEGPQLAVSVVRFEGNRIFSSQALEARLGEYLARYQASRKGYDAEIFEVCLRMLTNFVRSQGYLQAMFSEPKTQINETGLVFTIPVQEGALYYLGKIRIEGATVLLAEQIRAMLSLQDGDVVNGELIGKWLFEDLKKIYDDMGYIHFTAEPEPEFKVVDREVTKGIVDFKVTIEEGQQFRIRSIRFNGASIPEERVRPLLVIREGDPFNRRLFENSIERLNDSRQFEFIDKDKDTDFLCDEEEALIDIVIKINERHVRPFE